jgi:hypothetical protein
MTRLLGPIFAVGMLATGTLTTTAPAADKFDGAWSVVVITDAGTCDRAYRYGVRIENGKVHYAGGDAGGPVQISGTVAANGRVAVSVRSGDRVAKGSGRLTGDSGGGRWSGQSSTDQCSGRWEAERRG